jgi:hypothetical protein
MGYGSGSVVRIMVTRVKAHIYRILLGYGGLLHRSGVIHYGARHIGIGFCSMRGSMTRHLIVRQYIFY